MRVGSTETEKADTFEPYFGCRRNKTSDGLDVGEWMGKGDIERQRGREGEGKGNRERRERERS